MLEEKTLCASENTRLLFSTNDKINSSYAHVNFTWLNRNSCLYCWASSESCRTFWNVIRSFYFYENSLSNNNDDVNDDDDYEDNNNRES